MLIHTTVSSQCSFNKCNQRSLIFHLGYVPCFNISIRNVIDVTFFLHEEMQWKETRYVICAVLFSMGTGNTS